MSDGLYMVTLRTGDTCIAEYSRGRWFAFGGSTVELNAADVQSWRAA